ncbi:MAG TPA: hypothetical protein VJ276_04185 [Thermoanaerobaculia bacterium]|nr:hypothetical protein [Thermoanaerobaculia bacterium]
MEVYTGVVTTTAPQTAARGRLVPGLIGPTADGKDVFEAPNMIFDRRFPAGCRKHIAHVDG